MLQIKEVGDSGMDGPSARSKFVAYAKSQVASPFSVSLRSACDVLQLYLPRSLGMELQGRLPLVTPTTHLFSIGPTLCR